MLVIREEQFEVLTKNKMGHFVDRLVQHCRQKYPTLCLQHDDEFLTKWAQHCIDQAKKLEITSEIHIVQFLDLMMHFGHDIATSTQFQRITKILQPAHAGDRPLVFRLHEVSHKLKTIAKRKPAILIEKLELPLN